MYLFDKTLDFAQIWCEMNREMIRKSQMRKPWALRRRVLVVKPRPDPDSLWEGALAACQKMLFGEKNHAWLVGWIFNPLCSRALIPKRPFAD